MAGIFVPGPSPIYVMGYQDDQPRFASVSGVGASSSGSSKVRLPPSFTPNNQPQLLGIAQDGVHVNFTPAYRPMMANIGGHTLPSDRFYDGQEAVVVAIISIFNWGLLELLSVRPNPNKPNGVVKTFGSDPTQDSTTETSNPGIDAADAIGRPIGASTSGVQLLIRFPYQSKRQFISMAPGYRFFQTYLASKEITGSTKASRIPIVFQCDRQYDASTGKWKLYDSDLSAIAPQAAGAGTVAPISGFSGLITGNRGVDDLGNVVISPFGDGTYNPPVPFQTGTYNPYTGGFVTSPQ